LNAIAIRDIDRAIRCYRHAVRRAELSVASAR
jgi:hypothetical protein